MIKMCGDKVRGGVLILILIVAVVGWFVADGIVCGNAVDELVGVLEDGWCCSIDVDDGAVPFDTFSNFPSIGDECVYAHSRSTKTQPPEPDGEPPDFCQGQF